jgi:hypothetical protein
MAACSRNGEGDRVDPESLKTLDGFSSSPSYLLSTVIPQRQGERPECESCLPHAQMTQQSPNDVFELLKTKAVKILGSNVRVGRSTVSMPSTYPAFHLICQECHTIPPDACMTPGGPARGSEFAHIHTQHHAADSDFAQSNQNRRWQSWQGGGQGSMHLCLTLKDAAVVLEKGWGEKHLLAGQSFGSESSEVPHGLLLVYAPRTTEEVDVVLKILKASFDFANSKSD